MPCCSVRVFQRTLLPFIQNKFLPPSSHKLMQDNDPKHCLRYMLNFFLRREWDQLVAYTA